MSRVKRRIGVYINRAVAVLFYALILFILPRLATCDDNILQHRRGDESPSFQYTKQANEPYLDMAPVDDMGNAWSWVYNGFSVLSTKSSGDLSVWSQALGSTLLISAAPFLILFFVPLDPSQEKQPTLKILLSFASGGLLGDSFLHLIPHALGTHHRHHADHDHDHSDISHSHDGSHSHSHADGKCSSPGSAIAHAHSHVGLFVLLGIVAFLVIEKSVRLVNKAHSHSRVTENKKKEVAAKDSKDPKKAGSGKKQKKKEVISVAGYLNLAADFTHNLTDGLAIGASYLAGRNIGFLTTLTILLHEVPHEIGDFAILIQSGCSRRKAMGLQLVTALGAVIGTFIALMAEGKGDIASTWILPFTAGGFIYISTVSILPELLEDSHFFQSLKEIAAMLVGVLLMVLIADIE